MQGLCDASGILKIVKLSLIVLFILPTTEQSCSLEVCSSKLYDKVKYPLESYCGSIFVRRKRVFEV